MHNVGSIPIKVNQPVIGPVPGPRILTVEFQNCYEDGVQVEPGKEVLCTLHVHVERGAAEHGLPLRRDDLRLPVERGQRGPLRHPGEMEPVPADLEPSI